MLRKASVAVVIVCVMAGVVSADVPQLINYQGKLTNPAGVPIEGTLAVGFAFYDAQAAGNLLYSEQQTVTAAKGVFHVLIGNGSNKQGQFAAICTGESVWLQITVAGQAMAPRQRIGSVVFALKAGGVQALEARVAALEQLLQHFTRSGNDITVSGANLHIVNGLGNTETTNGLGNLIVGYNELRGDGTDVRTGSHDIVAGSRQSFSGYGGLVAGYRNTISGAYACVSGGEGNTASGWSASVSGGLYNSAIGWGTSVSGGTSNTASGDAASVSGGSVNTASSYYTSVSGGWGNQATHIYASVSGGITNTASGDCASVSGGGWNTASGDYSSVSGGYKHTAGGGYNWAAGGLFQAQ